MTGGHQLNLGTLPLDPEQVSALDSIQRAKLYGELKLDFEQRQACEDAVRAVIRGTYGRRRPGA